MGCFAGEGQVKVGDRLEITRTEEVAVRVEKVEKKK
jgi:hypothetical protein